MHTLYRSAGRVFAAAVVAVSVSAAVAHAATTRSFAENCITAAQPAWDGSPR